MATLARTRPRRARTTADTSIPRRRWSKKLPISRCWKSRFASWRSRRACSPPRIIGNLPNGPNPSGRPLVRGWSQRRGATRHSSPAYLPMRWPPAANTAHGQDPISFRFPRELEGGSKYSSDLIPTTGVCGRGTSAGSISRREPRYINGRSSSRLSAGGFSKLCASCRW